MKSRGLPAGRQGFSLIVVLLAALAVFVAVGGFVLLRQPPKSQEEEIAEIQVQGASDEVEAIEADVEATEFTSIDKDLLQIESELDAALSE